MRNPAFALIFTLAPVLAFAQTNADITADAVANHVLPRFEALADASAELSVTSQADCAAASPALRASYAKAFDAWIAASHLRFGPTERDNRAFALAFWPDTRGVTPKVLSTLIATADPVAESAASFADVSIAGRGFYAMEYLLFDEVLMNAGDAAYHCQLVRTTAADIAQVSAAILADWQGGYADHMLHPSEPGSPYRTDDEAVQELYKALSTGLEFTADTRLGRPMGTFERPRPARAEARRSGRSLHHVEIALASMRDLAERLAAKDAGVAAALDADFGKSLALTAALDDPVFANVVDIQGRLKVEVIQQSVRFIRDTVRARLGPTLGVAAGFNAMDGD